MPRTQTTLTVLAMAVVALCSATSVGGAAEPASRTWLENWHKNNPTWRALHLIGPQPQRLDVTLHVPADNKGIYCREWCPWLPEVDTLVFDLLDELLDAFDADGMHVGMDEVFLIGDDKCPRCRGKDQGELFAGVINRLHQHLVKAKGVEMLMWGDRLLDASVFKYGSWEASQTGSQRAIDRIPKDIIVCDWHYELRADCPSVRFFQEQGFRVLPALWKNPDAAVALIRCARQDATDKMLGVLFTGWSAGGNGEHLLAAWQAQGTSDGEPETAKRQEAGRQIAATIRAGLQALDAK